MSNQQIKIGLVALAFSTIMVFAATLPAVNALTPSSVYERYSQKTDRFPEDNTFVEKLYAHQIVGPR
jgi:hypothetical protein